MKSNSIFSAYGQWYFWDESQSEYYGPYKTCEDAQKALLEYSEKVLGR